MDGVLVKEGGDNKPPIDHVTTLDIGWIHDLASNFFSGVIDEVAIYNDVLTAEEIKKDMMSGVVSAVEPINKLAVSWGFIKSR